MHVKVCQKAFVLIHRFGKRRVEVLRKKFSAGAVLPEPDLHGRHENRPRKIPEEIHQKVRDHILSYQSRPSHYSRHKNSGRQYLPPELSIEKMYNMFLVAYNPEYVQYMKEKQEAVIGHKDNENDYDLLKPLVSKHYYNDVFVMEFNLHFGYPRSDTCDTCNRIRMELQVNDEDKAELQDELDAHLEAAAKGYDILKKDIEMSQKSWFVVHV